MPDFSDLPKILRDGYEGWRAALLPAQAQAHHALASGQAPPVMVISCCDSRVQPTELFAAQAGSLFVHRNIANLVPPYQPTGAPDGVEIGTAAAVEYAVVALQVKHLLVLGHSQCGGVAFCHSACEGGETHNETTFEFVGSWLQSLRPAYEKIDAAAEMAVQHTQMEQAGIVGSLDNLAAYPFVAKALAAGQLQLHGAWHDIASGTLYVLDGQSRTFAPII